MARRAKVTVEASSDVDVVADVARKDVEIPPGPHRGGIRVTLMSPESIHNTEDLERVRAAAREADDMLTIDVQRGSVIDDGFVTAISDAVGDEGVSDVTVRVHHSG